MTAVFIPQLDDLVAAVAQGGGAGAAGESGAGNAAALAVFATKTQVDAAVRYGLAAVDTYGGVARLADRTVNSVPLNGTALAVEFPPPVAGKARDFLARFDVAAATELTWPSDVKFVTDDDDVFVLDAPVEALLSFTEVAPGRFMVGRKDFEEVVA